MVIFPISELEIKTIDALSSYLFFTALLNMTVVCKYTVYRHSLQYYSKITNYYLDSQET